MPAPPAVEAYFASVPPAFRSELLRVRRIIRAASPGLVESISYGMPTFSLEGRAVVWIAAFKRHCSVFPGKVRFTPDAPLTAAFVRRLVRSRIAANRALLAKRAAAKRQKASAKRPAGKAPKRAASGRGARRGP